MIIGTFRHGLLVNNILGHALPPVANWRVTGAPRTKLLSCLFQGRLRQCAVLRSGLVGSHVGCTLPAVANGHIVVTEGFNLCRLVSNCFSHVLPDVAS